MSEQARRIPIQFNGNAREYFGIWIVNLLLSIVTLGVYSAWAKVRRKKYFYQNTLIEGAGFDYHANPVSILKGRVIAFVAFVLYQVAHQYTPIMAAILSLAFLGVLPWIIVRGNVFNARNSSHRGLRFNFVGTVSQAFSYYVALLMLIPFTLGLILPYIAKQRTLFKISMHRFGLTPFTFDATGKAFYNVYFKAGLVMIGVILLVVFAAVGIEKSVMHGVTLPRQVQMGVTLMAVFVGYILVFVLAGAYIQARVGNLVWNHTQLDQLHFESTLRARDFMWIYFSNFVLILFSFGLMTPWARVRTMRYRMQHLVLVGNVDLDQFASSKLTDMKAAGEEIADLFDVDLAIG